MIKTPEESIIITLQFSNEYQNQVKQCINVGKWGECACNYNDSDGTLLWKCFFSPFGYP